LIVNAFRMGAAPFGNRALRRMVDEGLPGPLYEAVRFLFTGQLSARVQDVCARVERRRRAIANMPDDYGFVYVDTPHGPARWPVALSRATDGPVISSAWLAHVAAVPARWGTFLHLCADGSAGGAMLELGASVGISAAYLASARGCHRLLTVEGSPELAAVARQTLEDVGTKATVFNAVFDEGLDRAFCELDRTGTGLHLVHIDGHHDQVATLHYLDRIRARLEPNALIVLDDIYLYEEMCWAWARVRHMRGMSAAVNLGRVGLLVWAGDDSQPAQFDLSRYTGWWRVRGSRRTTPLDPCAHC
jgi:predicted O-methyltransferase YrrM